MTKVINDLYDYNLKIVQDEQYFKFSLDSLLLAEFVDIQKKDKKLLDLCSGNAPLPMILGHKYSQLEIWGIEIQKEIYDLALNSIKRNQLENKINMLNINVLDALNYFPGNNFDIITCNPPFFKVDKTSKINPDLKKAIARHELTITLEQIICLSSKLLKDNGKLYLVHRPERLEEILMICNQNKLHVKEINFIYTRIEDCAIMVLLKFVKNSKTGTKIHSYIVNRDTKTYQNIFKKR